MQFMSFLKEENMPIHKARLSRAEEAAHLNRLQQMQEEGLHVEIPERLRVNSRGLEIVVAGLGESTVFESPTGGVCYAGSPASLRFNPG
jgi:hypothetical protein